MVLVLHVSICSVELDPEKLAKTKQWVLSKIRFHQIRQLVFTVKNRHVQFGDLIERVVTTSILLWFLLMKCMENFSAIITKS